MCLVKPVTGRLTNTSAAVLQQLGAVDGKVEQELHACQVKLITNVCAGAREAVLAVTQMRRAVLERDTAWRSWLAPSSAPV